MTEYFFKKNKLMIEKNKENKIKEITMTEMLKAGVHFGHQKSKWHPKMATYIYITHNNIHIINLEQTQKKLKEALDFIKKIIEKEAVILFVGTKKQAREIVKKAAESCGMPYVVERWLGGTFTNFKVILKQIKFLEEMEEKRKSEEFKKYTKKERLNFDKKYKKIRKKLEGIRSLKKIPEAIFVIDINKDKLAVSEAKKTGVSIIALSDTDADPTKVDYPIPANDDAISALKLMTGVIADTINEAKEKN